MTRSSSPSGLPTPPVSHAQPERDPISADCHGLLALFRGPLAEVRFPGVDLRVLAAAADAVRSAQLEVETLEVALDEARARTGERLAELVALAARGLAYARVFASEDAELAACLDTIGDFGRSAPHSSSIGTPRRRGRTRKDEGTEPLLPVERTPQLVAE